MAATPIYGLRYQTLDDAPHGANLGQNLAEDVEAEIARIDAARTADESAWADYTPTWTASGTNPTLGNGTIVGRYKQVGKLVVFTMKLIVGSTSTFGSGSSYSFGLPPVARNTAIDSLFSALLIDGSASTAGYRTATGFSFTANDFGVITHEGATGKFVAPTVPWAWATGDIVRCSGAYEAV